MTDNEIKFYIVCKYAKLKSVFSNTMDTIAIIYTILKQGREHILNDIKRIIFDKILLYLQVLLARPVRIAFLGKDVVLAMFVVSIAIPYVYEVFAYYQKILYLYVPY